MRAIAIGIFLIFSAFVSHAAVYESAVDVSFPDEIGGLPFVGRQGFPEKELGISLTYERALLRGSVFIYDGGLRSLPSGTGSEAVRRHFDQVIGDVKQMETSGQYRAVTFVGPAVTTTSYPGCGPQFLAREFVMVTREGVTRPSFAYLTVLNGNFVKLRVSYLATGNHNRQEVERFVMQLRKVLGKCPA